MKEINGDVKMILASGYNEPELKQTLMEQGDKDYDPLFPYGFGLTYQNFIGKKYREKIIHS